MSTCISRHGEFGSHMPNEDFVCQNCFALDEEGLRAEYRRLREPRTYVGTTHDGTPVVVTVHDAEGVADLAFADATGRFGPAVELSEEQA